MPIRLERSPERKLEDLIDLTENGDSYSDRDSKESQAISGAKQTSLDKAHDDEKHFAQFENFGASADCRSHKKQKPTKAPSARTSEDMIQDRLPFECGTCRQTFENIAELNDHGIKHEQPQVRCRKCRTTFTDIAERNHHFQTSPRHFCCRYCKHVVEFSNANSLQYHYIDHHHETYCQFCDRHFPNTFQRLHHMEGKHRECSACCKMFPLPELDQHRRVCYPARLGYDFPEGDVSGEGAPNYYARLGINVQCSHEEVLEAAKEMRIKMHPDRRKRQEGLTDEERREIDREAVLVGQAADMLSDPELRLKHDFQMYGWPMDWVKHGIDEKETRKRRRKRSRKRRRQHDSVVSKRLKR